MKTVCDFCKTEYSLNSIPNGPVKCAVCGNTWVVRRPPRRNSWLVFFAALCALLAAIVFAVAVMSQYRVKQIRENPLVAEISEISTRLDAFGATHFMVSGTVYNRSEQIYGVPGLLITSYDTDGNVVERQRFLPPATLLDSGGVATFSHILSVPTVGVARISVELDNGEK